MIVSIPPAPVHAHHAAPAKHRVKVAVVHNGDTLSDIAKREYGNADHWTLLYWENRDRISNPEIIKTGMRLRIAKFHPLADWQHDKALRKDAPAPAPKPAAPVSTATAAAPVAAAPVAATPSYSGGGSFQQCVIARESGGNPSVMNSSGHYGLYQFSAATWAAYGGNPGDFGSASAAEQNQVFANAMAQGGESNWAPYDGC